MNRIAVAALGLAACAALTFGEAWAQTPAPVSNLEVATFAAGCFWCTESDFDKVEGVVSTVSGFTGGTTEKPSYEQVGSGNTGHAEAVEITFDPTKVTYEKLLDHYWRNVDPVDAGGQFCDRGDQYRPAIFTHSEAQKRLAEASKEALAKSGRFKQPIVVEIAPAKTFTPAEDYHQDFYKKNPIRYKVYRLGCGRDARLASIWGSAATH